MRFIKNFQNNTTFVKNKDLIEYTLNDLSSTYKNILSTENSTFGSGDQFAITAKIKYKGMKVKVELVDENGNTLKPMPGRNIDDPIFSYRNLPSGWISITLQKRPTLIAEGIGQYDYISTLYWAIWTGNIKINFYERNYTTPTRTKIVVFK